MKPEPYAATRDFLTLYERRLEQLLGDEQGRQQQDRE